MHTRTNYHNASHFSTKRALLLAWRGHAVGIMKCRTIVAVVATLRLPQQGVHSAACELQLEAGQQVLGTDDLDIITHGRHLEWARKVVSRPDQYCSLLDYPVHHHELIPQRVETAECSRSVLLHRWKVLTYCSCGLHAACVIGSVV